MAVIIVTAIVLLLTFPFSLRIKFAFDSRRKSFFAKIYFYNLYLITIRGIIAQEIKYSIGKKIKTLKFKKKTQKSLFKKNILIKLPFSISSKIDLIYGQIDNPQMTSFVLGGIITAFNMLNKDENYFNKIKVTPMYNQNIINLKMDLSIMTSPLKIFSWLL